ncbi:hypothetical protein UFOVP379_42 [uncultured Caudovirales phage]|uniref:Uncharacterized protein n=1 Tax=uncultured Caudovirales phage TaxID=2100421 RepID=A0A6J7X1E0_9CAUD|nr:hypothetical protein UFOVP379_42 [uncultured Caudovirales phage]
MSKEALKLALEALKFNQARWQGKDEAITALREALAEQPQVQPCAGRNCGSTNPNLHSAECFEDYEKSTGMAQPEQEPVAWGNFKEDGTLVGLSQHPEDQANWTNRKPLYTHPPQRTWVGLTDEEIKKIAKKHKWHEGNVEPHLMPVFRSLEAKLKEKNT